MGRSYSKNGNDGLQKMAGSGSKIWEGLSTKIGRIDPKNEKDWLGKVERTDPKNRKVWLKIWEGLSLRKGKEWFEKWESLAQKMKACVKTRRSRWQLTAILDIRYKKLMVFFFLIFKCNLNMTIIIFEKIQNSQ